MVSGFAHATKIQGITISPDIPFHQGAIPFDAMCFFWEMAMKKALLGVSVLLCWGLSAFAAEDYATPAQAEALVAKTIAAIKSNKAQTFQEITEKNAKWIDRDLYPVVYDMSGKVLAHGQNPKMVDKDLIDFKDPDGKEFVKERVTLAKSKKKFWQDYKFTDPVTKQVLPKQAVCERLDDMIVCAGVYKR